MNEIRQFKPALYALTLLGLTGFAIASQSGALWVLGVSAVVLNYWLVTTGRFWPLPRLVANAITLLSVAAVAWIIRFGIIPPILLIGHFLVLLQVVKLYEQRANRDYAQLLVLGPLLMIAGAISTYSLIFGLIFFAYLILAMYCCMLFHLKVETDHARQVVGVPEGSRNPAFIAEQERRMGRSLRRLSGLISVIGMTAAVLTFLFFPRVSGMGLTSPYQWRPSSALTGFSDSVDFQNVAMIVQNPEPVAWVTVTRDGEPWKGMLWLRGLALERYTGRGDTNSGNAYQWNRLQKDSQASFFRLTAGNTWRTGTQYQGQLHQQIKLDPTGTNVLFGIGGIAEFTPREAGEFRHTKSDEVLTSREPILRRMEYEVSSRDRLMADRWPLPEQLNAEERDYVSKIDPRILEFALRPEVSGSDDQGPLAARRPRDARVTALDATIASNIETYLRSTFGYSLDLTDARRAPDQDPLVSFLYDLRRGHCEYFAGAMTLLCQSLGMQSRMVVGFRCDEYNNIGNYFTVRQLHAHAWVEVLNHAGEWATFDPTSGRGEEAERAETLWQRARALFSFLEYTWANSVIAYDPTVASASLVQDLDRGFGRSAQQSNEAIANTLNWVGEQRAKIFSQVIGWLIVIITLALIGAITWFIVERMKLRRRAHRIGLDTLPSAQRLKLARQLAFYDELVRLLERHRHRRAAHLTPLEFSNSLTFLPVDVFGTVRSLTETFYDVRYGQVDLDDQRQRELFDGVADVRDCLEPSSLKR